MQTSEAIAILTNRRDSNNGEMSNRSNENTAIDIAIAQLKGILDTPSADLIAEKTAHTNDVATLTSEKSALATAYDNALIEKDALITESLAKDAIIEDLQAQVISVKPIEV
jgi:hypothetical protein